MSQFPLRLLFCTLVFLLPIAAKAATNGPLRQGELHTLCRSSDRWYGGLCNGYITGTVETLLELREQGLIAEAFCIPAEASRGDYIKRIRAQLTQPKGETEPALSTMVRILQQEFPCQ